MQQFVCLVYFTDQQPLARSQTKGQRFVTNTFISLQGQIDTATCQSFLQSLWRQQAVQSQQPGVPEFTNANIRSFKLAGLNSSLLQSRSLSGWKAGL